jgi:hypothetical protein
LLVSCGKPLAGSRPVAFFFMNTSSMQGFPQYVPGFPPSGLTVARKVFGWALVGPGSGATGFFHASLGALLQTRPAALLRPPSRTQQRGVTAPLSGGALLRGRTVPYDRHVTLYRFCRWRALFRPGEATGSPLPPASGIVRARLRELVARTRWGCEEGTGRSAAMARHRGFLSGTARGCR